jgi:hypothetical protein
VDFPGQSGLLDAAGAVVDVLNTIASVVELGQKTNSYKFALTLALAEAQKPDVSAPELAEQFLGYYWPFATTYRIRQSTDPFKEPVAYKWSVELHTRLKLDPGIALSKARQAHPKEFSALQTRLSQPGGCLDEVLPRYHVLHKEICTDPIFTVEGLNIRIQDRAWQQIISNRKVIRQLAVGGWVRFCERISATPRLYLKLSGDIPKRKSLSPYLKLIADCSDQRCFYCGNQLKSDVHVDHFLPWSFVLEDKLWNLVPACGGISGCNLRKSDRIPDKSLTVKLVDRNIQMLKGDLGETLRSHKDLREWKIWDLTRHIEQLSATALAEGFPIWQP